MTKLLKHLLTESLSIRSDVLFIKYILCVRHYTEHFSFIFVLSSPEDFFFSLCKRDGEGKKNGERETSM